MQSPKSVLMAEAPRVMRWVILLPYQVAAERLEKSITRFVGAPAGCAGGLGVGFGASAAVGGDLGADEVVFGGFLVEDVVGARWDDVVFVGFLRQPVRIRLYETIDIILFYGIPRSFLEASTESFHGIRCSS